MTGAGIVLLGGGHFHLAALLRWQGPPPVLVTRAAVEPYSGLVPALLRRERPSADVALGHAVARAGGKLVVGDCTRIDLARRLLHLADGAQIPFGLLSLGLGAVSAAPPGTIPAWPGAGLPAKIAGIEAGPDGPVIVVGAGAVGTELALALALRWGGSRRVVLLSPGPPLPAAPAPLRRRAVRALLAEGVTLIDATARAMRDGRLLTTDGQSHEAAAVLWAASLAAPGLPRAAGLACDEAGFVLVDRTLRSLSHPFVFAGGDGAALGVAKSGAFAVRAGRVLAENLALASRGAAPRPWAPPRTTLAIVGMGHGKALAWRGAWFFSGRLAWRLKRSLDERWLRQFA